MKTKICRRCKSDLPESMFCKNKSRQDGLNIYCRECSYQKKKAWVAENKDHVREYQAGYVKGWISKNAEAVAEKRSAYYQRNKAAILAKQKEYYAANKERIARRGADYSRRYYLKNKDAAHKRAADWRKRNPEHMRALRAARRARECNAEGRYTKRDIEFLIGKQRGRCACCRSKLENFQVDHIMPLTKGGSNEVWNLQLLCQPCNGSKYNKHPVDFMQSRGYLL